MATGLASHVSSSARFTDQPLSQETSGFVPDFKIVNLILQSNPSPRLFGFVPTKSISAACRSWLIEKGRPGDLDTVHLHPVRTDYVLQVGNWDALANHVRAYCRRRLTGKDAQPKDLSPSPPSKSCQKSDATIASMVSEEEEYEDEMEEEDSGHLQTANNSFSPESDPRSASFEQPQQVTLVLAEDDFAIQALMLEFSRHCGGAWLQGRFVLTGFRKMLSQCHAAKGIDSRWWWHPDFIFTPSLRPWILSTAVAKIYYPNERAFKRSKPSGALFPKSPDRTSPKSTSPVVDPNLLKSNGIQWISYRKDYHLFQLRRDIISHFLGVVSLSHVSKHPMARIHELSQGVVSGDCILGFQSNECVLFAFVDDTKSPVATIGDVLVKDSITKTEIMDPLFTSFVDYLLKTGLSQILYSPPPNSGKDIIAKTLSRIGAKACSSSKTATPTPSISAVVLE